jgi:hypothetical protein
MKFAADVVPVDCKGDQRVEGASEVDYLTGATESAWDEHGEIDIRYVVDLYCAERWKYFLTPRNSTWASRMYS